MGLSIFWYKQQQLLLMIEACSRHSQVRCSRFKVHFLILGLYCITHDSRERERVSEETCVTVVASFSSYGNNLRGWGVKPRQVWCLTLFIVLGFCASMSISFRNQNSQVVGVLPTALTSNL